MIDDAFKRIPAGGKPMRALFMLLFLAVAVAPIQAQYIDPIIAITGVGGGGLYAMDQSGNVFVRNPYQAWEFRCNIAATAQRIEPAPFAALSVWNVNAVNCTYSPPCAITSTGEYYVTSDNLSWQYLGNVPQLAGHPAQGPFTSLTYSSGVMAITSLGETYVRSGSIWIYISSIQDDTGAVPVEQQPHGSVKGMFR